MAWVGSEKIDMAGENTSSQAPSREGRNTDSGHRESDIRLTLPAQPQNVAVVRHVLGALAEALAVPAAVVENMRLAVTEACTNVVRHAYSGTTGDIDVVVRTTGEALDVIVADRGRGFGPSPDTSGPGLGLPLIEAVTGSLEIDRSPRRGSRLIMSFPRTRTAQAMGFA